MKITLDYLFWCLLAVFSRIIPHLPDANALLSLCLLAGWYRSAWQAIGLVEFSLTISNIILAYLQGLPLLGWWVAFMYSGFIAITLASHYLASFKEKSFWLQANWVITCSAGYWLWSNLGVWLAGWYSYSISGLLNCYSMALPFLSHALLGNVCWFALCSLLLKAYQVLGLSYQSRYYVR